MLFECLAEHNLRIKHLGPADFADKQYVVLINNPEDVLGFLLEIDTLCTVYQVDPDQQTKKKQKKHNLPIFAKQ